MESAIAEEEENNGDKHQNKKTLTAQRTGCRCPLEKDNNRQRNP